MKSTKFLFFSFLFTIFQLASSRALETDCSSRDSCLKIGNKDFLSRNCECDRSCPIFGDCCHDAPNVAATRRYRNMRSKSSCISFGDEPSIAAYMVDRCDSHYQGSTLVRNKCLDKEDLSDPIRSTPITSLSSRITYRNRYCAECNHVSPDVVETWSLLLECESLESFQVNDSFIWKNLKYNVNDNVWGMQYQGEFHTCDILYDVPSSLSSNIVRLCRPDVVSTCPSNFKNRQVKRACESHMGVVYAMDIVYKNKYCALCNGVTEDEFTCESGRNIYRRGNPYSFALLLDVNYSKGDAVGKSEICPASEVYDPFFKRCRKFHCALPGFKMVNGKCQRK